MRARNILLSAFGAVLAASVLVTSMPAKADLKMRLEWTPILIHSWYFLAEKNGWYKQEGVKVTFEPGAGSVNTTQIVAAESHDIGQASHSAMTVGRSKQNLKVKAIASLIRANEMGILIPQGSGWKSPKDLVDNKVKIITSPGGFDVPFFEAWFRMSGTDVKKADFLNVSTKLKGSTYIGKKGDALSTSPAYFNAIFGGARPSDFFMMSEVGLNIPGTGIIASEKAINEKAAEIRGFLKATMRAFDHIIGGRNYEDGYNALIEMRPEVKSKKA
ncbi:MAG: ABC transporter substrate-binding protein, partial [Proteobacteria bacterium]|nr:ABC transporter substrate-binding protein [Pseudomonadota bacterium]